MAVILSRPECAQNKNEASLFTIMANMAICLTGSQSAIDWIKSAYSLKLEIHCILLTKDYLTPQGVIECCNEIKSRMKAATSDLPDNTSWQEKVKTCYLKNVDLCARSW